MLIEKTLRKAVCHFLLLLVGFDTLTYRKDYNRSPILVGHHSAGHAAGGAVLFDLTAGGAVPDMALMQMREG